MTRTMRMTAFFLSFILLLGLTPSPGMAEPPDDSGHSFFLGPALELDVTSFMTLKLEFEALEDGTLSMDDRATVSEKAWATGGSKMYVLVGTEVTVHDLVYGIAVSSGNDAAVALAEHVAGSEEVFVQHMNERARELGMENTVFKTAHGLTAEGQVTTAMDMALLAKAFIEDHPEAMEIMATREFSYQPPGEPHAITQYNRNQLLWQDERVTGLKTGHTGPAGFHLVATAEDGEMSLVAVVMGVQGETEAQGFREREAAAKALLNYGFGQFRTKELDWTEVADDTLRVWKGTENSVSVTTRTPTVVTYVAGKESALEVALDLPSSVDAPVAKGDKLGVLRLSQDDQLLREFDIVAKDDVPRAGFFKVVLDTLRKFFGRLFGGGD